MAYVESFARAMERARASVSYWDRKTLDHLQAAHDAEMRQCSKSEYHRGFEDGKATRDTDQWQLDLQRKVVVARLRKVDPSQLCGSHESLSAICKAVRQPMMGWTVGACQSLRDRLIALMGGDTDLAKTDAKVPDSGHVRECPQFPTATYDVLGNERQRAVCRLRGFEPRTGGKPTEEASKLIRCIIGREDCHVACGNDLEEARDRLIALLGTQDAPNATIFAGNRQNRPKSGKKAPEMQREMPESRYSLREVEPSSIADERHKVVCELRKMRLDTGTAIKKLAVALGIRWNAANAPKSCALIQSRLIHLLGGDDETSSNEDGSEYGLFDRIDGSGSCMGDSMGGSEHCEDTCDCGCERLTALDNGTCPNDDVTCPNNGPTSSITDELRDWVANHYSGWSSKQADGFAIADRIDAQFERICSQHESVLQQTISETINEHECEMDELRADYERATKMQARYGDEMAELRGELQVANQIIECDRKLAERNGRWCDALLDLIRDAAKDYRTASKVARRLQERASELRHERDGLLDLLRDAASEYQESQMWEQVFRDHLACMREQRDDLQSQLQAVRDVIDGTQQDDG